MDGKGVITATGDNFSNSDILSVLWSLGIIKYAISAIGIIAKVSKCLRGRDGSELSSLKSTDVRYANFISNEHFSVFIETSILLTSLRSDNGKNE
jgi:hypothetical protein